MSVLCPASLSTSGLYPSVQCSSGARHVHARIKRARPGLNPASRCSGRVVDRARDLVMAMAPLRSYGRVRFEGRERLSKQQGRWQALVSLRGLGCDAAKALSKALEGGDSRPFLV